MSIYLIILNIETIWHCYYDTAQTVKLIFNNQALLKQNKSIVYSSLQTDPRFSLVGLWRRAWVRNINSIRRWQNPRSPTVTAVRAPQHAGDLLTLQTYPISPINTANSVPTGHHFSESTCHPDPPDLCLNEAQTVSRERIWFHNMLWKREMHNKAISQQPSVKMQWIFHLSVSET